MNTRTFPSLEEIQFFVNQMNFSNSSLKKIEVIKQFPRLQTFFPYVYDTITYTYGVTSDNIKKKYPDLKQENLLSDELGLENVLTLLSSRSFTGHDAILLVGQFVEQNSQYEDLIYRIIDRDLKIRADASMINKVYPGCILTFDVALAKPYEDCKKKIDFEKDDWYASRKLDGCLHKDSIIEFEDGTTETIQEVVDRKINKKIKSFNVFTGKIEYKDILNWAKNISDIDEEKNSSGWYEIITEKNQKIILTGNHLVWCKNLKCWREVQNLTGEEELLLSI